MKILHLLSSNKFSGAENVACQIINMFGDDSEFECAYCSPSGEIEDALKDKNIRYIKIKKLSVAEVKRVIKEFEPDIIHAHDIKAICTALLTGFNFIVGHIHRNHPKFKKHSLRSTIFNHFARKKSLRSIIWVSKSCFEDYIFHNSVKDKSMVLENIIDVSKIIETAKSQPVQTSSDLVFVGRLTDVKNPLRLVEIVKLLSEEERDIKLTVVGAGELEEQMKSEIESQSLQNNIQMVGFQSNPYKFLSSAKIFMLTSKTEGLPMSILEAQAFGLPVVCPQIPGLEEFVKTDETGYLYSSNIDAKNYIINLLRDNQKYEKMKTKILLFSKAFNDKSAYKQKLTKLYRGEK